MTDEKTLDQVKVRPAEEMFNEFKETQKIFDDVIDIVSWMDGSVVSGFLWGLGYAMGFVDAKASEEYKEKIQKRLEDMKNYNEDVA